jgi:hypothetical protein
MQYSPELLASSAGFRSGFQSLVNQMWSVKSNIPIFATELGSNQRTFHGRPWQQYPKTLNTWSDTKPYWARVAANMLEIYTAGVLP